MTKRKRYRSEVASPPPLRRKPARRKRIRVFGAQITRPNLSGMAVNTMPLTTARWISLLIVLICCGLGVWLFISDTFRVYATEIVGNQIVARDQVIASSRLEGKNIFLVQPKAVATELKKLPYVLDAQVASELPNRVLVKLTERQPSLTWQVGDTKLAVDHDGGILPTPPLSNVFTIRVLTGGVPHFGEKVDPGAITTAEAIRRLKPDLTGLVYATDHGVGLITPEGWTAYLGNDPARITDQLELLDRLIGQLQTRASKIDFLDLRFPDSPFLKEK
jgi:cell division septal protein FtsQ